MKYAFCGLLLLCGVGCYDPHAQQSRIVREVESAGSGNLAVTTPFGLDSFFSSRPDLAKRIAGECAPLQQAGDAHWAETAEGMTCYAAQRNLPPTNWQSDGRAF